MIKDKVLSRLFSELSKEYPSANWESKNTAIQGFLEYVELNKTGKDVPMYSKSVDFVWHTFILDTKEYAEFCDKEFGKFLHHIPNTISNNEDPVYHQFSEDIKQLFIDACELIGKDPFSIDDLEEAPYLFQADCFLEEDWYNPLLLSSKISEDCQKLFEPKGYWKTLSEFLKRSPNQTPYQKVILEAYTRRDQSPTSVAASQSTTSKQTTVEEHYQSVGTTNDMGLNLLLTEALILDSIPDPVVVVEQPASTYIPDSTPAYIPSEPVRRDDSYSPTPSTYSCGSSSVSSCSSSSSSCSSSSCSSSSCSSSSCGGSF